jgi:hypothetical protein
MLVNDLIHGLYPEAVSIGEDVCYIFPFRSNIEHPFVLEIITSLLMSENNLFIGFRNLI